jgi:NitT/TauT family transport system ATP-binding protein
LLLDEPFSALDYQTRLSVGDDIGQIIRQEKRTAILVTHDLAEAISLGDQVLVLTPRPASVKNMIPLTFPPDKNTPLLRRSTPEFNGYFQTIWKELNGYDSSF